MSETKPAVPDAGSGPEHSAALRRGVARRALQLAITYSLIGALLFAGAGTIRWTEGWLYLGVTLLFIVGNFFYVWPRNPEVIVERGKSHEGTKGFDKLFGVVYALGSLALPVVAGLDAVRYSLTALPTLSTGIGVLLMVVGGLPIAWAMGENPFLETKVRIQKDRGHRVITTGPYRFVRHPMYVGSVLQHIAAPLVLRSGWAFAVTAVLVVVLVWRTSLEDKTLHEELDGYREYAATTRFRLIPGVW